MKKLLVLTLALSIAGIAVASSLSVPWFMDIGPAANKFPPVTPGVTAIVYLNNGTGDALTCSIAYFTQAGIAVGPFPDGTLANDNTFVIQAQASLAFRPVAYDPDTVTGGQEAVDAGLLVPDRPMGTEGGNDNKKNGSLVVTWVGESTDVQGVYMQMQQAGGANAGKLTSLSYLLPAGS